MVTDSVGNTLNLFMNINPCMLPKNNDKFEMCNLNYRGDLGGQKPSRRRRKLPPPLPPPPPEDAAGLSPGANGGGGGSPLSRVSEVGRTPRRVVA